MRGTELPLAFGALEVERHSTAARETVSGAIVRHAVTVFPYPLPSPCMRAEPRPTTLHEKLNNPCCTRASTSDHVA